MIRKRNVARGPLCVVVMWNKCFSSSFIIDVCFVSIWLVALGSGLVNGQDRRVAVAPVHFRGELNGSIDPAESTASINGHLKPTNFKSFVDAFENAVDPKELRKSQPFQKVIADVSAAYQLSQDPLLNSLDIDETDITFQHRFAVDKNVDVDAKVDWKTDDNLVYRAQLSIPSDPPPPPLPAITNMRRAFWKYSDNGDDDDDNDDDN